MIQLPGAVRAGHVFGLERDPEVPLDLESTATDLLSVAEVGGPILVSLVAQVVMTDFANEDPDGTSSASSIASMARVAENASYIEPGVNHA